MQVDPALSGTLGIRRKSIRAQKFQNDLTIVLFLLPAIIIFSLFVIYPIFQSAYYSFFNWKGFGPAVKNIGLNNYINILKDEVFLTAMRNCLLIVGGSLLLQLPMALVLAVLVGRDLPGRAFFRTVFFLPYVLSEVIAGIMWTFLFNPDPARGLVNAILQLIPGAEIQTWLGDPNYVMIAVFIALTWKFFGFHMLLYLTGIQSIPAEIEEAAIMDGANPFQSFFSITLPLLFGTIRTSVYLSVLGSLQQFIMIWIMTKGGPVNASETMATYMYRFGFVRFQLGYGSAVAIYMFLFCLIFSLIYLRISQRPDYLTGL